MHHEAKLVWDKCLSIIKNTVDADAFSTWFEPIVPVKYADRKLLIQVPSQFFYEWIEEHYVTLLRKALDHAIGKDGLLEYTLVAAAAPAKETPAPVAETVSIKLENYINQDYTFDTYIEGDCNRFARSASIAVSQKPGGNSSFNPLMIYGGVGLGKTHLVQAVGNHLKQTNPEKKIIYVPADRFTSQFVQHVRDNNIQSFNDFYQRADVLILDDVQFLAGKEKTQESLFHIFNHLHQIGKQIIMTSDRAPRDLEGFQDRILSRFKWGTTADLTTPDRETRTAIILKKFHAMSVPVPIDVAQYIAENVSTNVRELEGVIKSLSGHYYLSKRSIDVDMAKRSISEIIQNMEREISIDSIIDAVTDHFKISIADIKGKARFREVVFPRQVAMYLIKTLTNNSLKVIGQNFGGRDHSTVIHAIQTVQDLMDTEKEAANTVKKLVKIFRD